jgi:hypothetical protein
MMMKMLRRIHRIDIIADQDSWMNFCNRLHVMRLAALVLCKPLIRTGKTYDPIAPLMAGRLLSSSKPFTEGRPPAQLLFQNPDRLPIQFQLAFCCCKLQAIE